VTCLPNESDIDFSRSLSPLHTEKLRNFIVDISASMAVYPSRSRNIDIYLSENMKYDDNGKLCLHSEGSSVPSPQNFGAFFSIFPASTRRLCALSCRGLGTTTSLAFAVLLAFALHSLTFTKLLRLMHKDFSSSNGIFYEIASVRLEKRRRNSKTSRRKKAKSEEKAKSFCLRSLSCSEKRVNITFPSDSISRITKILL
jgi:hypothetical protein